MKFYRFSIFLIIILSIACGSVEERRDKFFQKGQLLFEKGDYVKARLEFKNAIQIDPKFAKGYYMVGLCAYQLRNWSEAFANFQRAIELDPHLYDAQIKIGQFYLLSKKPEKALDFGKGRVCPKKCP